MPAFVLLKPIVPTISRLEPTTRYGPVLGYLDGSAIFNGVCDRAGHRYVYRGAIHLDQHGEADYGLGQDQWIIAPGLVYDRCSSNPASPGTRLRWLLGRVWSYLMGSLSQQPELDNSRGRPTPPGSLPSLRR